MKIQKKRLLIIFLIFGFILFNFYLVNQTIESNLDLASKTLQISDLRFKLDQINSDNTHLKQQIAIIQSNSSSSSSSINTSSSNDSSQSSSLFDIFTPKEIVQKYQIIANLKGFKFPQPSTGKFNWRNTNGENLKVIEGWKTITTFKPNQNNTDFSTMDFINQLGFARDYQNDGAGGENGQFGFIRSSLVCLETFKVDSTVKTKDEVYFLSKDFTKIVSFYCGYLSH